MDQSLYYRFVAVGGDAVTIWTPATHDSIAITMTRGPRIQVEE